jgi:hypothetical protein
MPDNRPDIDVSSFGRCRGCLMCLGVFMVVAGIALAVPSVICGGQSGVLLVIILLLAVILLLVLTQG